VPYCTGWKKSTKRNFTPVTTLSFCFCSFDRIDEVFSGGAHFSSCNLHIVIPRCLGHIKNTRRFLFSISLFTSLLLSRPSRPSLLPCLFISTSPRFRRFICLTPRPLFSFLKGPTNVCRECLQVRDFVPFMALGSAAEDSPGSAISKRCPRGPRLKKVRHGDSSILCPPPAGT